MRSKTASHLRQKYGPWALVAGGSNGIGAEFARQLAGAGLNVLLVGRNLPPLEELAHELEAHYGVESQFTSADLAEPDQLEELFSESEHLDIGLVVANAALSVIGTFLDQEARSHDRLLNLNCRAPLMLAHTFGRRMMKAGRGGIVLLSSMAGFQGTALSAHYAASKAYVRVLAEGLWAELRPYGVDVLASCPGTVRTPTFLRDRPVNRRFSSLPVMECEPTVAQTLRALGKRPFVVPGGVDRIAAFFMQRVLPRKLLIGLTARATRGMYPLAEGSGLPIEKS